MNGGIYAWLTTLIAARKQSGEQHFDVRLIERKLKSNSRLYIFIRSIVALSDDNLWRRCQFFSVSSEHETRLNFVLCVCVFFFHMFSLYFAAWPKCTDCIDKRCSWDKREKKEKKLLIFVFILIFRNRLLEKSVGRLRKTIVTTFPPGTRFLKEEERKRERNTRSVANWRNFF